MERRLLEVVAFRGLLAALPFVIWFLWRGWALRTGRPMGATPWAWLVAAGAILTGLSVVASVFFQEDHRGEVYVPAEVAADGRVVPGHFVPRKAP